MNKKKTLVGRQGVRLAVIIVSALAFAHASVAAEISANLSAGIGASDNIARTPTEKTNETFRILGVSFALSEQTANIESRIQADFDFLQYVDNTFSDRLAGGIDAFVDFTLIDDRLNWVVEENFGQQLLNPLARLTPNNQEDINLFSTGPNIVIPVSARNSLEADLRYTNVNYEIRPFDNDRASATVAFRRDILENTSLSLNGFTERTEFKDESASPNFNRYESYIRYAVLSTRNTIDIDVGYTTVSFLGRNNDGLLVRANWTRVISPFSSFIFGVGTRYSDQGNIFRISQSTTRNLTRTDDNGTLGVPYLNNFLNASYSLTRERTSASAEFSWFQEDYKEGGDLDRDIYNLDLNLSRDLSRTVFVAIGSLYRVRDYKYQLRNDDDWRLQATFGYRFSPAFNLAVNYQYYQRKSDIAGAEFKENRAFLRFTYTPAWGR